MCQMANMIHYLILNSPLEVVEIHHHSDALFPDDRRRVPFGTGTSILYNNVDYRFRNNSNQDYLLHFCLLYTFLSLSTTYLSLQLSPYHLNV